MWYSGARYGFPRQHGWIEHWEGSFNQKVSQTVYKAIAEAISRPFAGIHTPRTCMLASVASVFVQNIQEVGSEQRDGRMGDGRQT